MAWLVLWLVPGTTAWWWSNQEAGHVAEDSPKVGHLEEYYEYGEDALARMGEYDYYYYDYPQNRQSGGPLYSIKSQDIFNLHIPNQFPPHADYPPIHPLAALIAPLAGLALMGAAAAVAVNPLLYGLVTISGRKRRSLAAADGDQLKMRLRQMKMLKQFLTSMPDNPLDRLTADYLSWSGLGTSTCLDMLACNYVANSTSLLPEREVVSIVLYNLMTNRAVEPSLKGRLRSAARVARKGQECSEFFCSFPQAEMVTQRVT